MRHLAGIISLLALLSCTGCGTTHGQVNRLREENSQLAERIRQDQVRLLNLEEQNRQLHARLADAEKAVAILNDAPRDGVMRR